MNVVLLWGFTTQHLFSALPLALVRLSFPLSTRCSSCQNLTRLFPSHSHWWSPHLGLLMASNFLDFGHFRGFRDHVLHPFLPRDIP